MPLFLEILSFQSENRNLHSIVSPRRHHVQTLEKMNTHRQYFKAIEPRKRIESLQQKAVFNQSLQKSQHHLTQNEINTLTLPFYIALNSKSSHTHHKRSFSNQENKFYSFKRIRQQKVRQQKDQGKVIKSIKINPEIDKPKRVKVIQHLDDVTTIESKNSPRSSLNSLIAPQIQESQIIMRGADLYDDLMKQNGINTSIMFPQNKNINNSIYQTPLLRKELCESINILNNPSRFHPNCFTQPKKLGISEEKSPQNGSKNCINSFSRYISSGSENNTLSFLKAKRLDKRHY